MMLALLTLPALALALQNGLARTPPMGWNSWNCYGAGVTAADLKTTADFLVSSGLRDAGYEYVSTDDGWMSGRSNVTGEMEADPVKFPGGWPPLVAYIHSLGLKVGLYSAASSVVCSGRVGSLYNEFLDAQTFADWGIDYVKYDNCGQYFLGSSRFQTFSDAVDSTGRPMVVSTEPFSLHPNPSHKQFSNLWRTTNDINANYATVLDRADTNDKWASIAGPGGWNDPDMVEIGNGAFSSSPSLARTHFGLWALMKSPLILGTPLPNLSPALLAIVSNRDVIAINQDALGVQGKKLAIGGALTPRFVGLAPCSAGAEVGYNGVSSASLTWAILPSAVNASAVQLYNNETARCLAMGPYFKYEAAPLLFPCNASDPAQAWVLPSSSQRMGALQWYPALAAAAPATALAVGASTLYTAVHGSDAMALPDAAYALLNITLAPYAPPAPCTSRNCDSAAPEQMWYWSKASGRLMLGLFAANNYRCFGPNCYQLTSHLPTTQEYCLSHVLSYDGNVGTGGGGGGASSVWGGPLSGVDTPMGDYVLALANHGAAPASIAARFAWLEVPGLGDGSALCGRELFSNTSMGVVTGGVTLTVPAQDIALLRFTTAAQC